MVFRQVSLPVVQGWEVLMSPDSLTYQQGSAGIWYQVPWLLVCWKCNVCPPPAPILNSPAPILSRAQRSHMTVYLRAWVWGQTALGSELTSPPTHWSDASGNKLAFKSSEAFYPLIQSPFLKPCRVNATGHRPSADWSISLPLCLPITWTLFFFLFIYLWPCLATCGISFPTRDRTSAPCTGSSKPWPLDHQGSPPDSSASPPALWFLLLSPLLVLPAPAPRCQPFSVVGQWPSSLSLNIPLNYLNILWLPLSFENYKKHS